MTKPKRRVVGEGGFITFTASIPAGSVVVSVRPGLIALVSTLPDDSGEIVLSNFTTVFKCSGDEACRVLENLRSLLGAGC